MKRALSLITVLSFLRVGHGFSPGLRSSVQTALQASSKDGSMDHVSRRRDFLVASTLSIVIMPLTFAGAATESKNSIITVLGANGRTGMECVKACLDRSLPVLATTRSGEFALPGSSSLLHVASCDVTQPIPSNVISSQTRAVIFAASASKQGGSPSAVDNQGLVNVAEACLRENVSHLVIVSSGGVSKPDSPVYKFLNLFGNIMEQKIQGEDTVRSLYRGSSATTKPTYTIIRPGGLTTEDGVGPALLELNQGDTKSGRIARADVGALCVEAILYPQLTGFTTFECYNADTAKPLQTVGVSNILKQTSTETVALGRERRGSDWNEIFTGLKRD